MTQPFLRVSTIVFVVTLVQACGGSPTAPGPTLVGVSVSGPETLLTGERAQLVAAAHYSDGSSRDVTAESTWSSSLGSSATVETTGIVTAIEVGVPQVNARFANRTGSLRISVVEGTTIGGRVTDTTNRPIGDAAVAVVGPASEQSRRTATDATGSYRLPGIRAPIFAVRYSHPSYQPLDREYSLVLGATRTDLDIRLTPLPPVARDDAYIMARGTVLRVSPPGLLANDSVPPGTTTPVRLVQPVQINVSNEGGNGGFTVDFSRNPGFSGRASFRYQLVTSVGNSDPATVTITVQ